MNKRSLRLSEVTPALAVRSARAGRGRVVVLLPVSVPSILPLGLLGLTL